MAIGLDRWLSYVLNDDEATINELDNAIASARNSSHRSGLLARRDELAQAQYAQSNSGGLNPYRYLTGGGGGYSSGGGSSYSSGSPYASPGFSSWLNQAERWNKAMDRNLDAIKSSSYDNYRNRYDY